MHDQYTFFHTDLKLRWLYYIKYVWFPSWKCHPEFFNGRVSFYWFPLSMTLCGQIRKSRQKTVQQAPANTRRSRSLSLVRFIDQNITLTQCRAGIQSPGNGSICQIQQVANQNQPTCSMMVPGEQHDKRLRPSFLMAATHYTGRNVCKC